MAETNKTRIGFVSGGASSMPHYNSFLPLVPAEIELEFRGPSCGIEREPGVHGIVSEEVVERSVEILGAALGVD